MRQTHKARKTSRTFHAYRDNGPLAAMAITTLDQSRQHYFQLALPTTNTTLLLTDQETRELHALIREHLDHASHKLLLGEHLDHGNETGAKETQCPHGFKESEAAIGCPDCIAGRPAV